MSGNKGLQAITHPNQLLPVTPSITKRKQVQQSNVFRSPTDNLISPCSLRILKTKHHVSDHGISTKNQMSKLDIDGKENEVS
ncbi:hypothetical protein GDO81_010311 [Engystomops pustulosus]|uniref:Uncharacterized protein n=1 Tax=Engystomops pustulosus TaxID=76066 RepID=A0AAV7BYP2_ENGPU|nr:hypothetical protein GDO81_010311 [Engystomops pustulosus]